MSIRVRLTLWYVALLGIVLIMFSGTFYGVLKFSLTTEVDRILRERTQQVALGIQSQNNFESVLRSGAITLPSLDIFALHSTFIQINDATGQPIKKSPNLMNYNLPIDDQILSDINSQQPHLKTMKIGGVNIRLYTIPLIFADDVVGMVQVGHPLTDVEETLQRVFFFLIGGTIIALIIASLFGGVLAKLSLQPIDQITSTANQIVSGQDLDQRLPLSDTNDELNRLSRTINDMLVRLDNFFQAQIRLSADISHELRTPLTIIRGNVDMLRQGQETPEERAETVFAIQSALDRMSRLVSDLLLLSQADAGMTLSMQPVEVDEIILDVFQQAQTLANGVQLKLGHADHSTTVYGDSDRLKQLLINLLDNAIKHTNNGGHVTLSVYKETKTVRISVSDTGQGISPEHLPHIFDRFYRVKGQRVKGSGLGLAIARWISEAHHGTLTAESKPGLGSTFTLTLPRQNIQHNGTG